MIPPGYGFICHTCNRVWEFGTLHGRDAYVITHGQCRTELFAAAVPSLPTKGEKP